MADKLKECPFCGGEAGIIKYMDGTYCVECKNDNCNMIAMTVLADTEARAVEIWNTRPNPWHTGTPTEEGDYLVRVRVNGNKDTDFYQIMELNDFISYLKGQDKFYAGAFYKVLAWQKIESL